MKLTDLRWWLWRYASWLAWWLCPDKKALSLIMKHGTIQSKEAMAYWADRRAEDNRP